MTDEKGTRRVNGEGSKPFQREGRKGWYSHVKATDPRTGEVRRVLVSARNKTELAKKIKDARECVIDGKAVTRSAGKVTFTEYGERWTSVHLEAKDVTPATRRLYKHALDNLVTPVLGALRMDKVREDDVKAVDVRLRKQSMSASSRRLAYNVTRMVFDAAVRDKVIAVNPAAGVERPTAPPQPQPRYGVADLKKLMAATGSDRVFGFLVPLMLWTALRPGEALALRWAQVDLDAGVLTVSATLAQNERGQVYRQPFTKGDRPRVVPLVAPVVTVLKAARKAQAAERLEVGEAWEDLGLVFCDQLGGLLDDRNLRRRYAPMVKAAGLTGSFHSLRRSSATLLTEAGVPLGVVAEILGHSSTAITQAHYTVVDTRMMRAALGELETFWEAQG